jgi:ABC-type amino acid transport substrate-binding protein
MRSTPKPLHCLAIALTFIFSFAATNGWCDNNQNYPPDIKRIKDRGKLIVAMYYKDVKPYLFHTNGLLKYEEDKGYLVKNDGTRTECNEHPDLCGFSEEYFIGHDVELAREIAKALGVEVEFDRSPKTFNAIIDLVASEEADMAISLVSRTLTRAEKVRFSDPYITLKPIILINRLDAERYKVDPNNPLATLQDFSGKIAEKKGTSYINIAKELFPHAEIIEKKEWIDAMTSVLEKNTIALRDESGVKNFILKYPGQSINMKMISLSAPRFADAISIVLPANSIHLQEWVNLHMAKHGTIGNADNLLERYREYYE